MALIALKQTAFISAIILCLLLAAVPVSLAADSEWTSVRSKNFLLIGNASDSDIRRVAASLEQAREILSYLLRVEHTASEVPTTVIVFKDDSAYQPFKPLYQGEPVNDVAGYFSGSDVAYITLSADQPRGRSLSALAFHEYMHLLVKNNFRGTPLWLNEGLAQYYSTLELSDNKVTLGKRINQRLLSLRDQKLLSLWTLFAVDQHSPFYNERDKQSIFYAQSWALVHYLLSGNNGQRQAQLFRYLGLLATGAPAEDSFRQAFQTDFTTIERELQEYIRRARYPEQVQTIEKPLEFNFEMQSAPVTEAEAQAYLGDLLLRTERLDAAEEYLQKALVLDPNLSMAQASLGILRMRQSRFDDARQHLERAIAAGSENYLVHYYYGDVLSRIGREADSTVQGYAETTRLIRRELKRVIELAPSFREAYQLLASVDVERSPQLGETMTMLNHALARWPKRMEFMLLLAQAHLRKDEFGAARQALETLMRSSTSLQLLADAQKLLGTVATKEEMAARDKSQDNLTQLESDSLRETQPCDMPQPGPQIKGLRFAGVQACGQLVRVECAETGVLLFVEAGDRTLKLHSDAFNRIRFVTYTADIKGRLDCGLPTPAHPVLVTYRAAVESSQNVDGEVIAVEFVPPGWVH